MRTARRLSAALVLMSAITLAPAARAAGADPLTASAEQKGVAIKHFKIGKELLALKKYEGALAELRASLDAVASPNVQLLIARCLRDMGRSADAWTEYGATASAARELEAKDAYYRQTAETAETEQRELAAKIALVTVTVEHATDNTRVTASGASLDRAQWGKPVPFAPGSIDFVVSENDKELVKSSLAVAGGDTKAIVLDAQPPKPATAAKPPAEKPIARDDEASTPPPAPPASDDPRPSSLRPWAYVAGGVGAAGLVTFAIFGSLEKGTYSNLQSSCPNNRCGPGQADDISTGRTQQTIANVGLGVGIAGAALSGILFVVSMPKSSPAQGAAPPAARAALVVGPSFIGVRGEL